MPDTPRETEPHPHIERIVEAIYRRLRTAAPGERETCFGISIVPPRREGEKPLVRTLGA